MGGKREHRPVARKGGTEISTFQSSDIGKDISIDVRWVLRELFQLGESMSELEAIWAVRLRTYITARSSRVSRYHNGERTPPEAEVAVAAEVVSGKSC